MTTGAPDGSPGHEAADDRGRPAVRYTLNDNQVAGDRLELLARIFGPASVALLRRGAPAGGPPGLAVDLGCGPGHTTRMIARTLAPGETVGLDASAAFVERAASETERDVQAHGPLPSGVRFVHHDVTQLPWPVPPADLVFARYLLAHLPRPALVVRDWGTGLASGGRLLLDEVERIDIDVPAFATYLEVSGAMIRAQGAELYVGQALRDLEPVEGLDLVESATATISPTTDEVARLFAMNLATWRHDPWIVDHVDPDVIATLATDLDALHGVERRGEIVWTHRQLVLERTAGR